MPHLRVYLPIGRVLIPMIREQMLIGIAALAMLSPATGAISLKGREAGNKEFGYGGEWTG